MQPDQMFTPPPPPTYGTLPGVASHNSVYSSDSCVEDAKYHLDHKGEPIDCLEDSSDWLREEDAEVEL